MGSHSEASGTRSNRQWKSNVSKPMPDKQKWTGNMIHETGTDTRLDQRYRLGNTVLELESRKIRWHFFRKKPFGPA